MIGHAQTSARARRDGKPLIIRRDFNTVDGGQAGLHFVSRPAHDRGLRHHPQRDERQFRALQNPAINDTVNNGINEFIFVLKRANYILPPRADARSRCCGRDYLGARGRLRIDC